MSAPSNPALRFPCNENFHWCAADHNGTCGRSGKLGTLGGWHDKQYWGEAVYRIDEVAPATHRSLLPYCKQAGPESQLRQLGGKWCSAKRENNSNSGERIGEFGSGHPKETPLSDSPKVTAIVTLMVNGRILEAECSVCHEPVFKCGPEGTTQDQESELREAIRWHAVRSHGKRDQPVEPQ